MAGSASTKLPKDKSQGQAEGHAQEHAHRPAPAGLHAEVMALQDAAGNRAVSQGLQPNTASPSSTSDDAPPIVRSVANSSGQPLDPSIRAYMESRFGEDFGDVRVHADAKAAESARALAAHAYTLGRDIVFGPSRYAPYTSDGKTLLAHELAHVVQQTRRHGTQVSNAMAENEAANIGAGTSSSQAVSVGGGVSVGVQRDVLTPSEAKKRYEELKELLAEKEAQGTYSGLEPNQDPEYRSLLAEYKVLDKQLNEQMSRTTPRLAYGTTQPMDKLAIPGVGAISLVSSSQEKASTSSRPKKPRTARGLTQDIVLDIGGRKITLAKANVQGDDANLVRMLTLEYTILETDASANLDERNAFLEQRGVVGNTIDLFSSLAPHDAALLWSVFSTIEKGRKAVKLGDLDNALEQLRIAAKRLTAAKNAWHLYVERHYQGGEELKQGIRDVSLTTIQVLAGLTTGGGSTVASTIITEVLIAEIPIAAQVALDTAAGDKIDWSKVVMDALLSGITAAVMSNDPNIRDQPAVRKIVKDTLAGAGSAVVSGFIDALRREFIKGEKIDPEAVRKAVLEQVLRGALFHALLASVQTIVQSNKSGGQSGTGEPPRSPEPAQPSRNTESSAASTPKGAIDRSRFPSVSPNRQSGANDNAIPWGQTPRRRPSKAPSTRRPAAPSKEAAASAAPVEAELRRVANSDIVPGRPSSPGERTVNSAGNQKAPPRPSDVPSGVKGASVANAPKPLAAPPKSRVRSAKSPGPKVPAEKPTRKTPAPAAKPGALADPAVKPRVSSAKKSKVSNDPAAKPAKAVTPAPATPAPKVESVEEYLARGGKITQIPPQKTPPHTQFTRPSQRPGKSRTRASVFGEGPEAKAVREVGRAAAGVAKKPRHHVFPKEHRRFFEERGLPDIDDFCVELEQATHQATHGGGNWRLGRTWTGEWNNEIMSVLRTRERILGRELTRDEIIKIGKQLMKDYKINKKFVPYID